MGGFYVYIHLLLYIHYLQYMTLSTPFFLLGKLVGRTMD